MRNRMAMSVLFPILAGLVIATYAGGLGVIFMLVHETSFGQMGVIILGLLILIGVPATAAIAQHYVERQ